MELKAALIQLNASDDPVANLPGTEALIRQAAGPIGDAAGNIGE